MRDQHGRPDGGEEKPLYDPNVPTPTHAERARTLVEALGTGTLCTIAREPAGYPYGSFVTFALYDGCPVFLMSDLAEHTRNLRADPRASLLVAEGRAEDPLANGRVTLLGPCAPVSNVEREAAKAVFVSRHPNAASYADYSDFAIWKLEVESVRYIGGYGRMSWVPAEEWFAATPDPIAPFAGGIIEHMNNDHADALVAYCKAFTRATDVSAATMTGIDRYGFEMSAHTMKGPRPIRLAFPQAISTTADARRELVALLERARARL